MRTYLTYVGIALAAAGLKITPVAAQERNEWTDLLAHDLKDWTRTGFGKTTPWRTTASRGLLCSPATETLLSDNELGDGTLKFEYRFSPTEHKKGYKASFGVRRTLEGGGCKIALGEGCGTLSATFQGSSDRQKTLDAKPPMNPAHDIGAWNAVKVQLRGRSIEVWINDQSVASFDKCDTKRGLFAIDAEGWEIEFRDVMWKQGK